MVVVLQVYQYRKKRAANCIVSSAPLCAFTFSTSCGVGNDLASSSHWSADSRLSSTVRMASLEWKIKTVLEQTKHDASPAALHHSLPNTTQLLPLTIHTPPPKQPLFSE